MAIGLAALGLLSFLLGCPGMFAETQNSERAAKSSLIGIWKNHLNSTAERNSVSNTGVSSGLYKTAVSASDKPIWPSLLQIIQHQGRWPVFTLNSRFEFSVSLWLLPGEREEKGAAEDNLPTTQEVESAVDDWGGARVGRNTFYRSK